MKLKEINRNRYLTNTPLLKWIKIIAYSTTTLAGVYSIYFYHYKAEEYFEKFNKFTQDLDKNQKRKQVERINKPVEVTAYRNYLKEKKVYQEQLKEETKIRLEKIRQASLAVPEVESTTPIKQVEQTAGQTKTSRTNTLIYYLTLGYWSKKE